MGKRFRLLVFVLMLLAVSTPVSAQVDLQVLENELMCYCQCNMVLSTCECEDAPVMRAEIKRLADAGMDREAILATFVEQYGETILPRPQARGFNLTAWFVPIAVLLIGAGILFAFLNRRSGTMAAGDLNNNDQSTEAYDQKLEETIKKYI